MGSAAPPDRANPLTGTGRTHTSPDRVNRLTGTGRAALPEQLDVAGQQEVYNHTDGSGLYDDLVQQVVVAASPGTRHVDGTDFTSQLQPPNTEHQAPGRSELFDLFQQPAELVSIEAYRT